MTTPVLMDINDSVSNMSFVMPSAYIKEKVPKPIDFWGKILHYSLLAEEMK